MVNTESLSTCFETLQSDVLPSLGIEDPLNSRIIASRLLVERLGEQDANYWWDSQILGEFGRDTLEEAVPRTATRAQIELAMKTGHQVEKEAIEGRSVSLFDLGPFVESQIEHELETLAGDNELTVLEDYAVDLIEKGWTESIVSKGISNTNSGHTFELGTVDIEDLQTDEVLDDIVSQLLYAYGEATKNELRIPYFRIDQ